MTASLIVIYQNALSPSDLDQITGLYSGAEVEVMPNYVSENIAAAYGIVHQVTKEGLCYRIHSNKLIPTAFLISQQPMYVGKFSYKQVMQIWDMSKYLEGIVTYQEFISARIRNYTKAYKKHFQTPSVVNLSPLKPMINELTKDLDAAKSIVKSIFEIRRLI